MLNMNPSVSTSVYWAFVGHSARWRVMALFSADDITYPPLDVPKPVADGVRIVDSGPLRVIGLLGLPRRA